VLPEYLGKQILAAAGIPTPKGALARTEDEAQRIAAQVGFSVALKAQSPDLPHKSKAGGLILSVSGAKELAESWQILLHNVKMAAPDAAIDGVLVEQMYPKGVELMAGVRNDPQWGLMLLVGFGGALTEAVNDVRLFPPDLDMDGIVGEILSLRCARLLEGFRGALAADVRAAAQIVRRLGDLALEHTQVREADLNPIVVYPAGKGAIALDALLCVE
jgi:acyl-CoA synthetase (NDP forming)